MDWQYLYVVKPPLGSKKKEKGWDRLKHPNPPIDEKAGVEWIIWIHIHGSFNKT